MSMQVVGVQLDIRWENKPANFAKVAALLDHAVIEPGSLIVLPEMFATGYSMDVATIHEGEAGETATFLREMARKYRSFLHGGLVSLSPDGRGRNESLTIDPAGNEIARYGKMHPFSYAGETNHYLPGERLVTFPWNRFTVAPFICYDLRFPEIFRHAVQCHANLFIVIANWPQAREEHWTILLQARAIENQAYVIGINRCGNDPMLPYSGRSRIIDPKGAILADVGSEEGIVMTDLDFASLITYRKDFPVLSDIRNEYRRNERE